MRTPAEIRAEVKALKALKPVGKWKNKTAARIELAIEELKNGIDDSAAEWDALGEEAQDYVYQTRFWKQGNTEERPSEGWGELVQQAKPKKGRPK